MNSKKSVYHQKNFLNKEELEILKRSVLKNYNPSQTKNLLDLDDIEIINNKIQLFIIENFGVEVDFLDSFLFFASNTTMKHRMDSDSAGWHTDSTCALLDGDCFNIWLPL